MTDPTPVPVPTPVPPVDPTALAAQIAEDILNLLEEGPTWKTTGFWVAVATMILGVLVTLGIIKPTIAASANVQEIVQLSAGIAAIVVPAAALAISEVLKKHNLAIKKAELKPILTATISRDLRTARTG